MKKPFVTTLAHHAADPFRLLVESVVDYAIVMLDPAAMVASWNPGAERIYGYRADDILQKAGACFYTDADVAAGLPAKMRQLALEYGNHEFECLRRRQDGSTFTAIVTLSAIKDFADTQSGFAEVTRDISEQRLAEESVRLERDLSNAMLESLPGIYYMFDESGHFLRWNQQFEEVSGYARHEIATLHPLELFEGPDKELLAERIASVFADGYGEVQAALVTKSGNRIPYFFNGVRQESDGRACLLGMGIDISSHKRAEQALRESDQRLQQAQKMEAIGQLAGGVAHDFNNLLTVINGYSEELIELVGNTPHLRDPLFQIHQAGESARLLTRQLLAFGRRQMLEPRLLNLNQVVGEFERILRRLIGENVILAVSLAEDLGAVEADPGQIEQILMNLVINARDAMATGGQLTIETSNTILDQHYCAAVDDLKPGPFVLLAVSDTGCGISAADRLRIFEPFYTTKGVGKGTGLGLATVHGIVSQSHGHVAVYSEPGLGTTFKVYLPLMTGKPQELATPAQSRSLPEGTETILLAEDDEAVRTLARNILQSCGYQVLEAAHGRDALKLADAFDGHIHLLLSDVVMPYLGGRALAGQIIRNKPSCQVLLLSGYADDAVVRHGMIDMSFPFLQKPFSPSGLAQKVRAVLDAAKPLAPPTGTATADTVPAIL